MTWLWIVLAFAGLQLTGRWFWAERRELLTGPTLRDMEEQ